MQSSFEHKESLYICTFKNISLKFKQTKSYGVKAGENEITRVAENQISQERLSSISLFLSNPRLISQLLL